MVEGCQKGRTSGKPIENAEFVEKFKRTFIEKLQEIPKKCGVNPKKTKIRMYAAWLSKSQYLALWDLSRI